MSVCAGRTETPEVVRGQSQWTGLLRHHRPSGVRPHKQVRTSLFRPDLSFFLVVNSFCRKNFKRNFIKAGS